MPDRRPVSNDTKLSRWVIDIYGDVAVVSGQTKNPQIPAVPVERTEALEAAESDRLLKPGEVRSEFGVTDATLREWDKSGKLPAAQRTFGGHRRYRESEVRALLAELRPAA